MKNLMTLMTGMALSSVLFTSCSKDKFEVPMNSGNTAASPAATIEITESPTARLSTAYLRTNSILAFENGKGIFSDAGMRRPDLLVPIGTRYADLERREYNQFKFLVRAVPNTDEPSMYLKGEVNINGERLPFEFSTMRAVELIGNKEFQRVTDDVTFAELLGLDVTKLPEHTTAEMWRQAAEQAGSGNIIRISDESNNALFSAFVRGMQEQISFEMH